MPSKISKKSSNLDSDILQPTVLCVVSPIPHDVGTQQSHTFSTAVFFLSCEVKKI